MFADPHQKVQPPGVLSRSGPALAVIGIHVILIYAIAASMGVVPIPTAIQSSKVVLIPETIQEQKPEPIIEPDIKPPMQNVTPEMPQLAPEVPPIETEVEAAPSETTIAAGPATPAAPSAPAQTLAAKQRVEPTYPPAARRAGEEGTVRLKVMVDERGRPGEVQVAQSSGFARLDDAAVQAVRRWRFQAATDGTNAVSAWTQVAISFKLTNN